MGIEKNAQKLMGLFPDRVAGWLFDRIKGIPLVKKAIYRELDAMLDDIRDMVKPYTGKFPAFSRLPGSGLEKDNILSMMTAISECESSKWEDGYVSGAVYHGDRGHIDFLNRVYALNSQSNPLHSDVWPSAAKYEAEIVSMTAAMLGADKTPDPVCGVVSSGGTESILLAMKAYRDRAIETKGIRHPEMVVPVSAHAAFDKAALYFGIRIIHVPVTSDFIADVAAMKRAVTKNTIVMVGSSPCFPHGVIDPIEELSAFAAKKKIGFHTDACLGGFMLPWAEKLGYPVPPYDFRLDGVTSMSADTHKYGYAAKGTSVVLYRNPELRRFQYFSTTEWPGGLYFSPTFAGSRPGALSAACWAAMVSMGEKGYLDAAKRILSTADRIKKGISEINGIKILGNPLWVIAFASDTVDIYHVMERMGEAGWVLNGLHRPSCVHVCVTLPHTRPGVADRFVQDLAGAVDHVRANPSETGRMAPVYGMAATLPVRELVGDMLERYIDLLYEVDP
ncbi:MAG: aminotransferase class V-fold PLP-dependent enzyme [Deltaproteobacteria bacterium]|nr:aminotransferase class V-fold PLP-dependent enzyme [Deltaproteobacteria bacterium]